MQSMKLSQRLLLLFAVALVGSVLMGVVSALMTRHTLEQGHKTRIRDVVQVAAGVLADFQAREAEGKLDRAAAQRGAVEALRKLRYGKEDYFFIYSSEGKAVLVPTKPEMEGKSQAGVKDAKGFPLFDTIFEVARGGEARYMSYVWPRMGAPEPVAKLSYVVPFAPWGWSIGTGVYVDDLDAAFAQELGRGLGIAALMLVVLAVAAYSVARSILQQIGGEPALAVEVMRQAAAGDLTAARVIDAPPQSLLGTLAQMFNQLRSLMASVGNSAENVAANAQHIARAAREVANSADREARATGAIAAAVEELTESVNQVSSSARQTEGNSSQAVRLAGEGEERAARAADEMHHIAREVGHAVDKIRLLVGRANEIGSIANVIKEIAAQTNLLALNAAIEAARAGEQGRGFAVVADEVRGLAERTSAATVQIEQMIVGIQNETGGAVNAMDQVANQVHSGVSLVESAAGSLREIRAGADVTLARIREVALATQEQSAASTSIVEQVAEISRMVEETSNAMNQTSDSVGAMERLAADLHGQVARFRV